MSFPVLSAQFASKGDRDHFLAVVLSSFAKFLACKVKDPESYLLQWIALEQELSDAEEDSAGDDTDGDGSDVN